MAIHLDVDGAYADTSFAQRLAAALDRVAAPDSYGEGPLVLKVTASEQLAPGVWRIRGPYNALAVAFADHIVLFEPGPQN